MRKYFLFIIRKDFYSVYKDNANILFLTLDNIYKLKIPNLTYGVSIYNQLCQTFNIGVINNYLKNKNRKYIKSYYNKFFINDIYAKEKTCVQVNHSCIVLKTNSNMPYVLQIFKWYNQHIFVCDFENNDYFWLNDYKLHHPKYEYSV